MKYVMLSLLALVASTAFAGTKTCTATKDDKTVVITIVEDDARNVQSLTASVDGARVGAGLTAIRTSELAGGVMVTASAPGGFGISGISIYTDDSGCFAGTALDDETCALGWINDYSSDLHLTGLNLTCN